MIKNEEKKDFSKSDTAIFISYILPHKKMFAADMFLSVCIALIDLAFPYVLCYKKSYE